MTRSLVRRVVWASVAGAVVLAGLALAGDARRFTADLERFDWSYFAAALALVTGNYALRFLRWELYLRRLGVRVPFRENVVIFLAGFAMSVTPAKLGEVLKSILLWELRDVPVERTAPIVVAERLTDLLALVLIAAVGAVAFPFGAAVAAAGAGFVLFGCVAAVHAPLGLSLVRLAARLPVLNRFSTKLEAAYGALQNVSSGRTFVGASALALAGWSLEAGAAWCILQGFPGTSVSFAVASFAYATSQIAGALAFMPGGLGVAEAGMMGVLSKLGGSTMTGSIAAASTALVRLATLWWAVLLGFIALPVARMLIRRRAPATP